MQLVHISVYSERKEIIPSKLNYSRKKHSVYVCSSVSAVYSGPPRAYVVNVTNECSGLKKF